MYFGIEYEGCWEKEKIPKEEGTFWKGSYMELQAPLLVSSYYEVALTWDGSKTPGLAQEKFTMKEGKLGLLMWA
jgi:hypothetical protein